MNIGICIINYNSYSDTIECIESLLSQDYRDFSIIIVDNASTNESVDVLSRYMSEQAIDFEFRHQDDDRIANIDTNKVWLIAAKENKGFSAGNNIAMRFVKDNLPQITHLLILNNDTVVEPHFLSTMQREYSRHCSYAKQRIAMGTTEVNYYTRNIIHRGANYLNLLSGLSLPYPVVPYFRYISGACLMVDVEAPLMCDDFFLYYDDVEYCFILRQCGYRLCMASDARYFHKVSATTSQSTASEEYLFTSMWRFFRRHYRLYVPLVFAIRFVEHIILCKKRKNSVMLSTFKDKKK